jgi:hypothetical protein
VYVPDASLEPTFTRMMYNADNDDLSRVEREGGELASAYWSAHPARWREQELWFDKEYAPEAIWERRQHEDGFYGAPLDVAPPGWVQSGGPTPENEPLHRLSAALGKQLTSGFSHHASRGERLARAGQILFLARLLQDPDYCWDRIGLDQDDGGRRLPRSWLVPSLAPDKRSAWARLVADALAEVAQSSTAITEPPTPIPVAGESTLLEQERTLLETLEALPLAEGLIGKNLLAAMAERHAHGITQGALTSRLIPGLRGKGWIVPNKPGVGYHLSSDDRERLARVRAKPEAGM